MREAYGRAADIGSGDGHLCAELKACGWQDVIGVEVSSTRVARARHLYPDIKFYDRPFREIGLPGCSFDLIVMESVIEHLPEPVLELGELRKSVRSGGRVVVTTPNMDSGHFRLLGRRWTGMLAPHAHIFLFTADSLGTAMKRAGFHLETTGSFRQDPYTLAQLIRRFASGDFKGALWRAHQELGTIYGHLIAQEPMLFAVGRAG